MISRSLWLTPTLLLAACAASGPPLPSFVQLQTAGDPHPAVQDAAWEGVEPVPLELDHVYRIGQRLAYDVHTETTVDRGRPRADGERASPERIVSAEELVRYDVRVESVDEWGGAKLRVTPILLELDREGLVDDVSLDTDDGVPTGDPEVDAEAQRVGMPLTIDVDHRGRLLAITGAEAFLAKVADQLPAERRWDALEDFEVRLGPRALLRQLQELFVIVPEERLQPGDTWEELLPTGNPKLEGEGHFRQTYVYLGQTDRSGQRCAKIFFWRVFEGREEEGHGQRVWVPPHAAQGSLYVRVKDGLLIETEPLWVERLVVERMLQDLTIYRSRVVSVRTLDEEW